MPQKIFVIAEYQNYSIIIVDIKLLIPKHYYKLALGATSITNNALTLQHRGQGQGVCIMNPENKTDKTVKIS